jgi:hypothetical protein
MHQSREAHPLGAATPLPGGRTASDAPSPRATVQEAPGDPSVTALLQPSGPPTATPGRHDPSRPPRAQVQHAEVERPVMCSVTAMRPVQIRAQPDAPLLTLLLSRGRCALMASWPFASHSNADAVVDNGSGRRLTSVSAGQSLCGAPRRNRTGDPILTMDRRPSAVLTRVFAARAAP